MEEKEDFSPPMSQGEAAVVGWSKGVNEPSVRRDAAETQVCRGR